MVFLWLWCRLAAAAPIRPLAWELPYAAAAAMKRNKEFDIRIFLGFTETSLGQYIPNLISKGILFTAMQSCN